MGWTWRKWRLVAAWSAVMLVPCSFITARVLTLDSYYALLAWILGMAILLANYHSPVNPDDKGWKTLALTCAVAGNVIWLACAYTENLRGAFNLGLFASAALLVLCRAWCQLGGFGIQLTHTLVLFLVGLPILDLFTRPEQSFDKQLLVVRKYYQYEAAKKDPAAFAAWWKFYNTEWRLVEDGLFDRTDSFYALRPKPNSRGKFFDSEIEINSGGFRGKEFSMDKGGAYRIIALGESTTFGVTMTPEDKPWPELLEEMIRQRLKPARRVEVINAGVPTYWLGHNLQRLASEILPLKPDMIISYHGYNGFPMLYRGIPPSVWHAAPAYRMRPIKLLADYEYRFKLSRYRKRLLANLVHRPHRESDPMKSDYAHDYERLIVVAQTNKIRLVLANFSMAVNEESQLDVVQFYRVPFPAVYAQIKANAVHSVIVQKLARKNPGICFVDTHPNLDGAHDRFVDLIHLAQDGRHQLAENMFDGIRDCLLQDLSKSTAPARSQATGIMR